MSDEYERTAATVRELPPTLQPGAGRPDPRPVARHWPREPPSERPPRAAETFRSYSGHPTPPAPLPEPPTPPAPWRVEYIPTETDRLLVFLCLGLAALSGAEFVVIVLLWLVIVR